MDIHLKILAGSMLFMTALTFYALMAMFKRRVKALKTGEIKVRQFSTYETEHEMPAYALQGSRHYKNLFEMPVLFYVIGALAFSANEADLIVSILSVLFCLLRLWHTMIHLGANNVILRMRAFGMSLIPLMGLWIYVTGRIFLS